MVMPIYEESYFFPIPIAYTFRIGRLAIRGEPTLPSLLPKGDSGSNVNPSGCGGFLR